MCGGYQAQEDDLLQRKAMDRNSEIFMRRIGALLHEIEDLLTEMEQTLAVLEKTMAFVNKISYVFGAILVVLYLFNLLKHVGLL